MTSEDVSVRAGRREWIALGILCLPSFLSQLDVNITILALPKIATGLHAGANAQLWVTDIYAFMITGFLVTMGNLGDRFGRRRMLLIGAAGFVVGSLGAAFSTSVPELLISRALLGVAGATVSPNVLALIRNLFKDPKQLGMAMGAWGMSIMLGLLVSPPIGGLLLNWFWWGSIFLIAVPVMAALLVVGPVLIPESRSPRAKPLDRSSVVLWLATLFPLIWAVMELTGNGWQAGPTVALIVGVLSLLLFLRRQRRRPNPLLDLRLFRSRGLTIGCLALLLYATVLTGIGLETTVFMQSVLGLSPLHVTMLELIPAGIMLLTQNGGPLLIRVIRPGLVFAGAATLAAAGCLVITLEGPGDGVLVLMVGLTIVSVFGAMLGPLCGFLVMTSVTADKAGAAGALPETAAELGPVLGISVLGVIASTFYRHHVQVPAGIPAQVATTAHQSINGTDAAARTLPGQVGTALAHSANAAYTSGMHIVAVIALVVFVFVAAMAGIGLRRIPLMTHFEMPVLSEDEADDADLTSPAAR